MEETLIVDIVVEVHVDSGGLVREQEPAYLGNREPVCLRVHKDGSDAQTSLQKAFDGIFGMSCRFCHLFKRQTFAMPAEKLKDSVLDQQSGSLKDNGAERDELRHPLRLPGAVRVFCVPLFKFGEQFHLLKI